MTTDYYNTLGVDKNSDQAAIKAAYRQLAKKYHPDRSTGDEEKFKEVQHAYDVLSDPQKRSNYDQFGSEDAGAGGFDGFSSSGFGDGNLNDIFAEFFGGNNGGRRGKRENNTSSPGSDIEYKISISLEQAYEGFKAKVCYDTFAKCNTCNGAGGEGGVKPINCHSCGGSGATRTRQGFFVVESTCRTCHGHGKIISNPCKKCQGEGRSRQRFDLSVDIPAGVDTNSRVRVSGKGEAGIRGGRQGDLYVTIGVKQHDFFQRKGADLHCKQDISFVHASIGGEIKIQTIDGNKINVKIPVGTQPGNKLRVQQRGMKMLNSSSRGNLYIEINIKIPKKLSKKQINLLEEFEKEEISNNKSTFERVYSKIISWFKDFFFKIRCVYNIQ